MIIGGERNNAHLGFNTVLEYDIEKDSIVYLPSLPHKLKSTTAVRSGNYMYVFGGWIDLVVTNRVLRISLDNLESNSTAWEELTPMSEVGRNLMVVPYNHN